MVHRRWAGRTPTGPCAGLLALSLAPTGARAEESASPRWEIGVKAAYVVLGGRATRATGGIMPSITGLRRWPIREAVDIGIGADVGLFGLGGDARWLGVLGGPAAAIRAMPFRAPLSLELTTRLDFGRIPVCNAWGLCLRYLGLFPAVEAGAAYLSTQHVAIVATCGVRFINTLAWSGVSVEPAAAGRIFW
ncbi:hypothetical protein SCE1572_40345 [Sorangium cellulosum So0157-2]|uniref:Secreted protein n=2 Tax=Sorangium cellulosum TaxID=56 RepID=S4YBN5_SORCE|nr:hypothetical protein SCE1572_40345 [Sorangium cellulosum So0157-2]